MDDVSLVRRHWERNARGNAFGAILTRGGKVREGWDPEAFFATGRADVAAHLEWVKGMGAVVPPGRALDFGCGVGRLTRPLRDAFGAAVGVDVSERMIGLARQLNSGVRGLEFVHNVKPDLGVFAEGAFDFVYSLITLQHMPAELQVRYLTEFARVCRPGGWGVVQVMTAVRVSRRWYWPPTAAKRVWRWINQRIALRPVMAMYAVSESEVRRRLREGGAEVVDVLIDESAGKRFDSRVLAFRRK